MSDYELVTAFVLNADGLQTTFTNFVAVLFAFLIAAYLVADKLESNMVFIVVGLFTLVAVQQAFNAAGFGNDVAGLARQIAAQAAHDPAGLGWHGTAATLGAVTIPFLRFSALDLVLLIGALAQTSAQCRDR